MRRAATQVRGDYEGALRFFSLADTARPTPQSKFLLGTAALNVSKAALTEAPKLAERPLSCELAKLGGSTLTAARTGLEAGSAVAPDVAKQYLDYVGQLAPFADRQVAMYCGEPGAAVGAAAVSDTTRKGATDGRNP